ncbi:hypothetical protein J3D46_005032 [Paenarthrobacter sp. A20]|nr:hypothetical protein [Paenarthrobacter sp. A20]
MDGYVMLCFLSGLASLTAITWHVRARRQRLLSRLQERNRQWSARFREDAVNSHD